MEINKICSKIKEYGHVNSKRDELREYCRVKFDLIVKFLPRRILNSDGSDLLDCIFNGLSDSSTSNNKVKIIDGVLETMRKESSSISHCGDVISRICLELPRQPPADLVRWSDDCVQSIVEDSDVNMIWRDVLPECLTDLAAHSTIKHCATEMTVPEYKEQCVKTLCQCRWREKQLVQLAAMFRDMNLPRNEHRQVVNKLCSHINDLSPDELPPLVHQLLKLCKVYNVEIVLAHLSHFFSVRLYSKLEPPLPDSEATTMEVDDIDRHSPAELSGCLSTCLYHISQGAAEPELIRKHLKMWPKTQLLRSPFLLDLALAVSDKGADFRSVCLDVIKAGIEQRIIDDKRSKESAWARSVLPPDVDVASVLKVLTTESANHRQLTVVGLINLAFSLLAVPRTRASAAACWSHGKLILVRLAKSQPETASHILSQLADRLATDCSHKQYADCLHVLCALSPVSIERCSQLSRILENCQPSATDYRPAAAVLDAVHPLLSFSTRTRDTLVMVCRKGLYSRDSMHRCLALSGFLSVLRHVKVSRTLSSSQSCSEQYSAHSYLTQLTVDLHHTQQGNQVTSRVRNEAMCMEVISILRRCLVQDAAVKQLLYTKIYDCAKEKPVLHESILELLYEHLGKYLPEASAEAAPLLLDKCVQVTPITAVLTEPIARLLYVIAQFLQPSEEEDDDILASQGEGGSAYLRNKLANIMEQICASRCDYFGINMEDQASLTDLTPESKAKALKVQQAIQCYEALVAYQMMTWNRNSENSATTIYRLYKNCNQLLEHTKATPKIGKKASKSTLNETRESNKSQKTQRSQKEKGKGPTKVSNLVKDRAGPFKPLPCLWDLKVCLKILELLYSENVSWCTVEQRNQLRARREVHHWALRNVISSLAEVADSKGSKHVAELAGVIYSRCICRFQDICAFDEQTAQGCVDVFKECLTLLFSPSFNLKLDSFLPVITGTPDTPAATCIAAILEQLHSALTQADADVDADAEDVRERDAAGKKLVASLVGAAAVLLEAPEHSQETMAVILKLEDHIRTSKRDCLALVPSLLAAMARDQEESQFIDDLLLKLTTSLGKIEDEDTASEEDQTMSMFPTIDARSGHTVLNHICAHLNHRHKSTDHQLHRARDLTNAINCAVQGHQQRIDRELSELYKSLVLQLCQAGSWTRDACSLRTSVGVGSEKVLASAVRLLSLLATFAKQLDPHTAQAIRFDRLLKVCGKKLSAVLDNLITYLEASQQQQQSANKVLKDTKLIPRLVLEAELFSKNVILLATKGKLNYQQYLSLGTARDFRIKGPVLQEALQARQEARDEDDQLNIEDAETTILSPLQSDNEQEVGSDDEDNARKRRRVS